MSAIEERRPNDLAPDHAVVLLNYLLLGLSPVTFFISGLVAVIVGLIRKGGSDELARSHFRFQRSTYWIVLVVTIIALIGAVIFFATGIVNLPWGSITGYNGAPVPPNGDDRMINVGIIGFFASAGVLGLAWLFGLVRIIFGVIRVAMGQPIGRTPLPRAQAF